MSPWAKKISNPIFSDGDEVFLENSSQVAFIVLILAGGFNRISVEMLQQNNVLTMRGCLSHPKTHITSKNDDPFYRSYKEIRDLCPRVPKPKATDAL